MAKKETVEDKIKFIEGKYVCRQKKLIGLKEFSKNRTKDIFELKPMFNLEKSPMFKNYFIDNNHFYYFNVVSYEMYKYDYFKRDLLIIKLADSINYLKSNYDSVYNHKFVSQSLLKTPLNERIITVFDLGDNILIMRTKAKDFFSKKYKFDIINKKSHHVDSIFELDSYDYNYKTDTMHKILKSFKELPFMFTHTYTEFGERYFIVTRAFNKLNSKIGMRQKEIIDDNSTCFHTKNYTIKYYIFKYIIE